MSIMSEFLDKIQREVASGQYGSKDDTKELILDKTRGDKIEKTIE